MRSLCSPRTAHTHSPRAITHTPLRPRSRLREEKLERRVKKELPVLSKRLRAQVLEWEAANGTAFMIEGACPGGRGGRARVGRVKA